MDPERPIEKLLHHTAQGRKAQAGEPFELHAADRALLQAEVARQFARQPATRAGLLPWRRLWPRLAWALGLFAILGLIVWAILPPPSPSKQNLTLAKAPATEPEALPTAQTTPPSPPPPAAPAAAPAKSRQVSEPFAAESPPADELRSRLATRSVQAESPKLAATAESRLAVREAGSEATAQPGTYGGVAPAPVTRGLAGTAAQRSVSAPSTALPPRKTDSHSFGSSLEAQTQPAGTLWVRAQVQEDAEAAAPTAADSIPVLSLFYVEHSANEVRVVDHDGSVYLGSLRQPPAAAVMTDAASHDKRLGAQAAQAAPAKRSSAAEPPSQASDAAGYFRVAGTNRTLNQPVVFTWKFVTNAVPKVPQPSLSGTPAAAFQRQPDTAPGAAPWQISGQVILENGKVIPINALPRPSK